MDAVIRSLDKNYRLCDTRITESKIILNIASTQEQLCCPYCGTMTDKVHSYHTREIQDLPISDRKTILLVTTRKMKCLNPECDHKTFAERHPFVNPNAQKTNRLIERILKTSSEMSSVCSSRLLKNENIIIGKSSICTLLKKTPLIVDKSKVYRVCIDDFALKKRYSYGTVMVDWDTHRIIDMIPSRESFEVSVWLSTYPNITMISRDGASGYASAGAKAHPDAVQVTDRFSSIKEFGRSC